jgi:Predicted transcriptional regulators
LPIYEQIKVQIKEQIMDGSLHENELLPSIRQLAKDLGISVITTAKAYTELENEGFLATMQGKGTFVQKNDNSIIKEQYLVRIEDAFNKAIGYAKIAKISKLELVSILNNLMGD